MNPEFPIFIPSKGRSDSRLTMKALDRIKVPYTVVIEPQEYAAYKAVLGADRLLVTPHQNQGLTVTRNWIWDHVQNELQTPYFWTIDDNIREFYRLHCNVKYRVTSGTFLHAMEQFAQRYVNLYISGMAYEMFVPRKHACPVFILNTRIYSNMLIKTGMPYRNRLFRNDDTDLCLQVLKGGHCTCEFNVFLADKVATMYLKGGMTPHYQGDGRYLMAKELQEAHPDVVKITRKWGRWQHQVDYRPFKGNKLIRRPGVTIEPGINNYGMQLIQRSSAGKPGRAPVPTVRRMSSHA